jgi:hypothetical protein
VLEQEVARGHFHPFKERKGQRPLRFEKLKLKRIKTCARSEEVKNLFKVQRRPSSGRTVPLLTEL